MFPFNLFPYTNFHDINMDWIIKNLKTLWGKAVFSVNNTTPDEDGNINLPGVSGVSSVDGIGADGAGNVQLGAVRSINSLTPNGSGAISLVTKPALTYYSMQNTDFSNHVNTASGILCWRSGVASLKMTFTVLAGTSYGDDIVTFPGTFPEKSGEVILIGYDSTMTPYPFSIQAGTGIVVTRGSYAADTTITMYGTWLTYPAVSMDITNP